MEVEWNEGGGGEAVSVEGTMIWPSRSGNFLQRHLATNISQVTVAGFSSVFPSCYKDYYLFSCWLHIKSNEYRISSTTRLLCLNKTVRKICNHKGKP